MELVYDKKMTELAETGRFDWGWVHDEGQNIMLYGRRYEWATTPKVKATRLLLDPEEKKKNSTSGTTCSKLCTTKTVTQMAEVQVCIYIPRFNWDWARDGGKKHYITHHN